MASKLVERLRALSDQGRYGALEFSEAARRSEALIEALEARERVLVEFVRHVAKQPTADEMDEDYYEAADFEGAYGAIIDEARRAASALEAK